MEGKYGNDPKDVQSKRAPGGGLDLKNSDGLYESTEECLKEEGSRTEERIDRQGWHFIWEELRVQE